jgi:septal ring factor EnvC (AmiA/AmiB activator)
VFWGYIVPLKLYYMGIFWDLMQQDELNKQQQQADSLEDRVAQLEADLAATKRLLRKTLEALETHLSKDIDGDGQLG